MTLAESIIPESQRPESLTAEQMAAVLNVSRDTLDRWSWIEGCPVTRDRGVVRFWWKRMIPWVQTLSAEQLARARNKPHRPRKRSRG